MVSKWLAITYLYMGYIRVYKIHLGNHSYILTSWDIPKKGPWCRTILFQMKLSLNLQFEFRSFSDSMDIHMIYRICIHKYIYRYFCVYTAITNIPHLTKCTRVLCVDSIHVSRSVSTRNTSAAYRGKRKTHGTLCQGYHWISRIRWSFHQP